MLCMLYEVHCLVDRCRLQFDYHTSLCILISWLVTKYRSKTTGFAELLYIFLRSVQIVEAALKRTVVVITW